MIPLLQFRSSGYLALKQAWTERCLAKLFKFYPKCKGRVVHTDLSTPLSIAHYLNAPRGGAVGLETTPDRFMEWDVQRHLDISTPIGGLYMTGQDQVLCGVVMAQLCGVITAMRILGPLAAIKMVLQSIFFLK